MVLLLALSTAATAAACSGSSEPDGCDSTVGVPPDVVLSTLEEKLTAAGVDARNEP